MGEDGGLRQWSVAGGVLVKDDRFLLVQNKRRNGDLDWSTPGGVVDPGESILEALSREVAEETGLLVTGWTGPLYRIEVTAPGYGFYLQVEAHLATGFAGDLRIDDPDGIVIDAEFVDLEQARQRLVQAPPWVGEPLLEHLSDGVSDGRLYSYRLDGTGADDRQVVRL